MVCFIGGAFIYVFYIILFYFYLFEVLWSVLVVLLVLCKEKEKNSYFFQNIEVDYTSLNNIYIFYLNKKNYALCINSINSKRS